MTRHNSGSIWFTSPKRNAVAEIKRPFLHPESLQTLLIPSSMLVRLLFSSLTHVLQGSGQRTRTVIAEATHICVVFGLLYSWKIQHGPLQ